MAKAAGAGLAVAVLSGVAGHDHLAGSADEVIRSVDELEPLLERLAAGVGA
jgi:phosphoglycolate phosphatase-like HAD superfamily hydrolase